jgi:hypothetical protein
VTHVWEKRESEGAFLEWEIINERELMPLRL